MSADHHTSYDDEHVNRRTAHAGGTPLLDRGAARDRLDEPGQLRFLGDARLRGRGNAPLHASTLRHAQRTYGNRSTQRFLQRAAHTEAISDLVNGIEAARPGMREGAGEMESSARSRLERSLGADLSGVRIHTGAQADQLARSTSSLAFTTGRDIFFRSGAYDPQSPAGVWLLAHEATHVVQQERAGDQSAEAGAGQSLSQRGDASEQEAERAAGLALSGQSAQVSARPSAAISRFELPGLDDLASGAASVAGGLAGPIGAVTEPLSRLGSDVGTSLSNGSGFGDALTSAVSKETKLEQQRGDDVQKGAKSISQGVDRLEGAESGAAHWLADQTQGIPLLGSAASAGADWIDFASQVQGGILKGATDFAGGLGSAAANPIGTAKGLGAIGEHIPSTATPGGMFTKFESAAINVATGQETLGQAENELLDPTTELKKDSQFFGALGSHILKPYEEAIDQGKYGEVGGRAIFDIGSLLIGAGETRAGAEAGALGKAAEGLDAAGAAAKGARELDAGGAAVKAAEEGVPPTLRSPGLPSVEPLPATQPKPVIPEPVPSGPATEPRLPATQPRPTPGEPVPPGPATEPAPRQAQPLDVLGPAEPAPPSQAPATVPSPPAEIRDVPPPSGPLAPDIPRQPEILPPPNPVAPREPVPNPFEDPEPLTPATPTKREGPPSEVPPSSTEPAPIPTQPPLPPEFLENPRVPGQPEGPGFGERVLEEEADLGRRIERRDDELQFQRELEELNEELKKRQGG